MLCRILKCRDWRKTEGKMRNLTKLDYAVELHWTVRQHCRLPVLHRSQNTTRHSTRPTSGRQGESLLASSTALRWSLPRISLNFLLSPFSSIIRPPSSILGSILMHLIKTFSGISGQIQSKVNSEVRERAPKKGSKPWTFLKIIRNAEVIVFIFKLHGGLWVILAIQPSAILACLEFWALFDPSSHPLYTKEPAFTKDKSLFPHLQKEAQKLKIFLPTDLSCHVPGSM